MSTAPFLLQELSALEALWQGHAHGVFNHAWAGKANQGVGFGDDHVTHKRKAC